MISLGAAGASMPSLGAAGAEAQPAAPGDRALWVGVMQKLADPVLNNLAVETLKQRMPVEQASGAKKRETVTHLEALGRLIAGIAPWLELAADDNPKKVVFERGTGDIRPPGDRAGGQSVIEGLPEFHPRSTAAGGRRVPRARPVAGAARAPGRARTGGEAPVDCRAGIDAHDSARRANNWLLFSATVEAALGRSSARAWDRMRVDYALRQHDQWYKGDGAYGDGPEFHWDYYNSFVIHPMLLDVLDVFRDGDPAWKELATRAEQRARRYAAYSSASSRPTAAFPAIGRSIAYRFGAFQLLAQMALRRALPEGVSAAQTRGALTAVIRRSIEDPETFDAIYGWLRIGFCGHQPGIGERYISTGSL